VIDFCFGADSRARHRRAAQQARARWLEHGGNDDSLRCDIDHPDDLDALVGQCQSAENERAAHTRGLLRAWLAAGAVRGESESGSRSDTGN
jgi:2-phospho-L-lactate guanylyltransferase (CobY/MobA/RfbA family)